MRFRITYDGELKAAGKSTRSEEKWAIRRQLHPQLAELWEIDPALNGHAILYPRPSVPSETVLEGEELGKEARDRQRDRLRTPIQSGGHNCIPLVRNSLWLTCSLDILFLRKEGPGALISRGGDLDNRIKTLFDGLRMPTPDEGRAEKADIDPLFCLLEDDALITDLVIRTDRLLCRPNSSISEVRLVIDVVVLPTQVKLLNSGFLGN
jgi:hypothetical protein